MRITNIYLKDIRCFKELNIKLKDKEGIKDWLILVGDNGEGKTTLLRSIGIGLCDKASASGLLREIPGEFVRKGAKVKRGEKEGTIRIDFEISGKKHHTTTKIKSGQKSKFEELWREPNAEKKVPWKKFFVVGYGAGRGTQGTETYEKYSVIDAIYSLYRYDAMLQNPELSWRRLETTQTDHINDIREIFEKVSQGTTKAKKNDAEDHLSKALEMVNPLWAEKFELTKAKMTPRKILVEALSNILTLKPSDNITLERNGIFINNIHLSSLGDGYKSVLSWVLDMLSWWSLNGKALNLNKINGIVIVDEIEQHLHPRWQRIIIDLLANNFPKLQFIVSTHSPLCAASSEDIPDGKSKLLLVRKNEDGVSEAIDDLPYLSGMSSDQVLSSKVFGYLVSSNIGAEKILKEGSLLAGKGSKKTKSEERRYKKIKEVIKKMILSNRKTLIEEEAAEELNQKIKDEIQSLENELFADPEK